MKIKYVPKPLDISGIELPEELNTLIEKMAENVHEVWAQSRMAEEWSYGEERNDPLKHHPCLIPYEELPENTKKYIARLEELIGLPVSIISVGPDREQTIFRK